MRKFTSEDSYYSLIGRGGSRVLQTCIGEQKKAVIIREKLQDNNF